MSEPAANTPGATASEMNSTLVNKGGSASSRPPSTHVSSQMSAMIARIAAQGLPELTNEKLLADAPKIQIGERIYPTLGSIPLLTLLGRGGMGAVYLGLHPRLSHEVAVKVLPYHLAEQQPQFIQRLYREAQIAARVKSPHLVSVLDVNEEHGLFYMVMEYVEGEPAGTFRRKAPDGKLKEAEALDILIGATQGLAVAHAEGVVHRDIKPDNILIPRHKGRADLDLAASKLADLGLARAEGMEQSLTGSNALMGTVGYMAPEQAIDAKKAQKPADVFSMGATLYALLTGRAPFVGETPTNVVMATINSPHTPIEDLRSDLTDATRALLKCCLAKDPALRFVDGSELHEALKLCRAGLSTPGLARVENFQRRAAEVGLPAITPASDSDAKPPLRQESTIVAGSAATSANAATFVAAAQPPKRSRTGLVAAAVLVLALGGAGTFLFLRMQRDAKFENDRTALLGRIKPAMSSSGSDIDQALDKLRTFRGKNDWATPGQMQPVDEAFDALMKRAEMLKQRKDDFDAKVAGARGLIQTAPEKAVAAFNEAKEFGRASEKDGLPDLLTGTSSLIEEGIVRAEKLIAIEQERQRKLKAFRDALAEAQSTGGKGDWIAAERQAKDALLKLDELPDEQRGEAQQLIEHAAQMRADFTKKLEDAQALLKKSSYPEAIELFSSVQKEWSEAPAKTIESGVAEAQAGMSRQRFEAAITKAKKELEGGNFNESRAALQLAEKERANSPEAQKLQQEIAAREANQRYDSLMQAGAALLKAGEFDNARKTYESALTIKPNDAAAAQKKTEAVGRALLKQGDDARTAGDKASAEKFWAEAMRSFPDLKSDVADRVGGMRRDAINAEFAEINALIKAQKFADAQARAVNAQQLYGDVKEIKDIALALDTLQRAKALGKRIQTGADAALAEAAGAVKVDDGDKEAARIKSDLDAFSAETTKRNTAIETAFADGKFDQVRELTTDLEKSSKKLQDQCLAAATYFDERAAKNVPKQDNGPNIGIGGLGGRRAGGLGGAIGGHIPVGGGNAKKAARYNDIATNLKAIAKDLP